MYEKLINNFTYKFNVHYIKTNLILLRHSFISFSWNRKTTKFNILIIYIKWRTNV